MLFQLFGWKFFSHLLKCMKNGYNINILIYIFQQEFDFLRQQNYIKIGKKNESTKLLFAHNIRQLVVSICWWSGGNICCWKWMCGTFNYSVCIVNRKLPRIWRKIRRRRRHWRLHLPRQIVQIFCEHNCSYALSTYLQKIIVL